MHNSPSSVNTLYTAECTQFYSIFLPTTINLTRCCCQKCEVWHRFFTDDTQCEKNEQLRRHRKVSLLIFGNRAQVCYAFSEKTGVIWNILYLGNLEKIFLKMLAILCFLVSIKVWMMQRKDKNRLWKSCACIFLRFFLQHLPWEKNGWMFAIFMVALKKKLKYLLLSSST